MLKNENKTEYTEEDYLKIHNLVYEFKNGSQSAMKELIKRFEKFFINYAALIKYGKYNLYNFSTTSFIKLFVEDKFERKLINPKYFYYKGTARGVVTKTVSTIKKIFQNTSQEDLMQDLKVIFITMCTKYKDTNPTLHHYIYRNFHFYAFRYWEKNIGDPLGRNSIVSINNTIRTNRSNDFDYNHCNTYEDIIVDDSDQTNTEKIINNLNAEYIKSTSNITILNHKRVNVYDDNYIDDDWINGATCTEEIFKILTPLERQLIKYWYIDGYTDTEIGRILCKSRCNINKRKNIAKNKIIQYVKNKPCHAHN